MTVPPTPPTPRIVDGERRVITILFCDVVGSTQLAGQLDPEEWAEVMNEAFQYMIAPIQEYDGMVARLMGDAVLAFFGAPQAHEDDPQRAVLAGLGIVAGMRPFIKQFHDDYGLDFSVRVGINTGPVVVGEIGSNLLQEYTAMGDAINLAARMEQTALPGTVQISEDTYRLVAPLFDVWDLGGIDVKGKDEPVQAYRVLGVDPQPGRMRGIEGLETPLIGRAREVAKLRETLDGLAQGRGRIVFLLGEAGLGKSRLIAELRREWRGRLGDLYGSESPVWSGWTEFLAVSYGASRPYDMLKRQLRQYCGIRETDPPAVIHERLNRLVTIYPEDLHQRLHRIFGFLLGDTVPDGGPLPEGEAFKRELRAALLDAAAYQTDQGPVVFVMDDLHWGDPASIEALSDLLALVGDRAVLFLLALRPDWNTPGGQLFINSQLQYAEQCLSIFLEPLSRQDGRALITALLGDNVPRRVLDAIQQKAEGNPLFIEEIARALVDNEVVVRTENGARWQPASGGEEQALRLISLPGNVQALMTARIDRLEPDVRRTLQLAAVIGRSFPLRVLEQMAGPGVDVAAHLQTLSGADLIRPDAGGEGDYTFLHALARDAAYETILLRQRRRYHRQVAEVIEAAYPDRLAEESSRLAYHYAEARDWPRALRYYRLAGDTAAQIYAHAEAIEHYSRAIDLAATAPGAVGDDDLIALYLRCGRIHELQGEYDQALAVYEALEQIGRERGNAALELAAIPPQAIIYVTPNSRRDGEHGAERARYALALGEAQGDPDAQARAHWSLLLYHLNSTTDLAEAIGAGERALALAREHGLREVEAYVLNDLGRAYGLSGRMADAMAAFDGARALWTTLGNNHMLADTLAISAQAATLMGRLTEAVAIGEEGLALAGRIGSQWGIAQNSFALGVPLLEQGHFEAALDLLWQAVTTADRAGFRGPGSIIPIIIAYAYAELLGAPGFRAEELARWLQRDVGTPDDAPAHTIWQALQLVVDDPEDALALLRQLPFINESVGPGPDGFYWSLAFLSVLRRAGDPAAVLARSTELLDHLRALGMDTVRPLILWERGLALRALGDDEAARATLTEAAAVARGNGSHAALWRILCARAELASDRAEAAALREEALAEVNELASGIDDPTLYSAFLAQPAVHDLLRR